MVSVTDGRRREGVEGRAEGEHAVLARRDDERAKPSVSWLSAGGVQSRDDAAQRPVVVAELSSKNLIRESWPRIQLRVEDAGWGAKGPPGLDEQVGDAGGVVAEGDRVPDPGPHQRFSVAAPKETALGVERQTALAEVDELARAVAEPQRQVDRFGRRVEGIGPVASPRTQIVTVRNDLEWAVLLF